MSNRETTEVSEISNPGTEDRGLDEGAIGFLSNVVIGVSCTAPGYTLVASLGTVVALVGLQAPAILIAAFVPMLLVATAYYYLNKEITDCGTSFAWCTAAIGPYTGWLTGWIMICAFVIVMSSQAEVAGLYTLFLLGLGNLANSTVIVVGVGVFWVALMTVVLYLGVDISARTQFVLLGVEIIMLAIFSALALFAVYTGAARPTAILPEWSWLNPLAINSFTSLNAGLVISLFVYWGWDSAVTANEESEDSSRGPGLAAVVSTVILVGIYLAFSISAQAYGGTEFITNHQSNLLQVLGKAVFGPIFYRILLFAILTSSLAASQTTMLACARTIFSMSHHDALPKGLGKVHPRFSTPHISTILVGALSIGWYVGLTFISQNVLSASLTILGLMIAFYYGITGIACVVYYRHELTKSTKSFLFIGVAPAIGGIVLLAALIKQMVNLYTTSNGSSIIFGLGLPLVTWIGVLVVGCLCMIWMRKEQPSFFDSQQSSEMPAD